MSTPRTINCPTCHNGFPVGEGMISVCPRCGERVLIPAVEEGEGVVDSPQAPAAEIASLPIQCQLCGSRYYAKPDQVGQTLKCPDCHTNNVVRAPDEKPKKSIMEALADDEDFKLSDPVETPRYQALARDAVEFERALRSQQGLQSRLPDVAPTPVRAPAPVPSPAQPPRTTNPPAAPSQTQTADGGDDLAEMGLLPLDGPPESPQVAAAPPQMETNDSTPEASSVASSTETPPLDGPAYAFGGGDVIDLFPEDRIVPAASSPAAATPVAPAPTVDQGSASAGLDDEEGLVEVSVSAPVERVEHRAVYQMPKADRSQDKDDGSDFVASVKSLLPKGPAPEVPPELAQRKPFSLQSLGFLLHVGILGRWVGLTFLLIVELLMLQKMFESFSAGGIAQVAALLIYLAAFVPGFLGFLLLAMFCFTIVQDTANGEDRIESWAELNWFSWFESAMYFSAAFFVGGLPGALLATAFTSLGAPFWVSPLLLLPSLVVLFPPVLISMLEAGSVMEPISVAMLRSFLPLARYWATFYGFSLALGLFGLILLNFASLFGLVTLIPAAAIATALPFIYFRLLGRMAMMYRDYVAATAPDEEDDESGRTIRHIVQ